MNERDIGWLSTNCSIKIIVSVTGSFQGGRWTTFYTSFNKFWKVDEIRNWKVDKNLSILVKIEIWPVEKFIKFNKVLSNKDQVF